MFHLLGRLRSNPAFCRNKYEQVTGLQGYDLCQSSSYHVQDLFLLCKAAGERHSEMLANYDRSEVAEENTEREAYINQPIRLCPS